MSRNSLQFQRRGRSVRIGEFSPRTTLLDWLRLQERSIRTKEGCAERDCGACAVVVVRERDGRLVYEPVNSCITLLGQLDGAELITVEDLADEGVLHPVQEAMARDHGSQCGFCTPGIVMSLFAHYHECNGATTRDKINDALVGNLCRCTGYRPIVDAALEVCNGADDQFTRNAAMRRRAIAALNDKADLFVGDERAFFAAPASEQSLAQLYAQHPDATIVAGATDVGLWITKKLTPIEKIVHVGRVAELSAIEETADGYALGAIVSLARAAHVLGSIDPDMAEVLRAEAIEEKLRGLSLNDTHGWQSAAEALSKDFTPLTDLRASAAYRSRVAGNLVVKAIAEIAGVSPGITRVADHRMLADAAA